MTIPHHIFILTGAGISAESGVPVFQGTNWRGHSHYDLANIEAWHRDPALVWEYYSERRARARDAQPNPAHFALAKFEQAHGSLFLCTQNVDDLHSANNNVTQQTSITEKGETLNGMFEPFNKHDMLTGSQADGRAFPGNLNLTCNNWTSSTFGVAMLGHHDRRGGIDNEFQKSWNSSHISRGCRQEDLIATGGNGLFYCFAAD